MKFRATIHNGRYSFDEKLPTEVLLGIATRCNVLHSYTLFTGYIPKRIRGASFSFQVLSPR